MLKQLTKGVFILALTFLLLFSTGAAAETLTLSLIGDCSIGGLAAFTNVEKEKGIDYFYSGLYDVFSSDDLTLANCEGVLTNRKDYQRKKTNIKGEPRYADFFSNGSIEAVNIANNHTMDYFAAGKQDTIAALEERGVGWFGGGELYVHEVKGIKIGMTGYSYPHRNNTERFTQDITKLREMGCSLVIVSLHWGREEKYNLTQEQRSVGPLLIELGADIVFGHGPHVLQPIQIYQGKPIFYSLANFTFGAHASPKDDDTTVISLQYNITKDAAQMTQLTAIPCKMHFERDFRPYVLTDEAARKSIFQKLVFSEKSELDSGLPDSFLTTGIAVFY